MQELPATETGPVPVEPQVAQRRIFGVPPATVLLVLGVVALGVAIILFATGRWPWGLIVIGVAIWLITGFISQARRLPDETPAVARASLGALGSVRARAGAAVETVAAHGTARIELARLRREVGGLASERSERLRELGEAVYEGNSSAAEHVKQGIEDLDKAIKEKEMQMANVMIDAQERIGRAQLQVQPTEILGEEVPGSVPEPATVPEPFPPPDEGQPPEPARVPEPFPPPDEGDRPEQPSVPEPGPQ